jgi:hypothetical protein
MGLTALVMDLVRRQHGLVSRDQALRAGLTRGAIDQRIRRGDWESIGHGVCRLPGAPRTWHQRALALCLGAGSRAATSHRTAGWLWGLDGVSRQPPEPIDLVVPHDSGFREPSATVRRTRVLEAEFPFRNGVPVTLLSRTLVDLASILSEDMLEVALDSAIRSFGSRITKALKLRLPSLVASAWPGVDVLKRLFAERDGSLDSPLEVLIRRVLWLSELPRPHHNWAVFNGRGFVAKVDFAWPAIKLALQAHGLKHHLKPARYRRDQVQQSEMQASGWLVLTTTWREVNERPFEVVERLKRAYALRTAEMTQRTEPKLAVGT